MHDRSHDKSWPVLDVIGAEPQHPNALLFQPRRPTLIVISTFPMRGPIDLHAQLFAGAIEIQNEWPDRVLAAEVQVELIAAEHGPECPLRAGHRPAQ